MKHGPRPAPAGVPGFRAGLTLGAGAAITLLLDGLGAHLPAWARFGAPGTLGIGAVIVGALVALSGLIEGRHGRAASVLRFVAWGAFLALALPTVLDRPAVAFALVLFAGGFLAWPAVERVVVPRPARAAGGLDAFVLGAVLAASAGWVLAVPGRLAQGVLARDAVLVSLGLATALGALATVRRRGLLARALGVAGLAAVPAILVVCATFEAAAAWLFLVALLFALLAWFRRTLGPGRGDAARTRGRSAVAESARLLITTFLVSGLMGGCVLTLPVCAPAGQSVSLIDAMFTSFSAVCVTGLGVLDTARDFSATGQSVILVLLQIGGLGTMTFSAAAIVFLGRRMSLRQEAAMSSLLSSDERGALGRALRRLLVMTLVFELVGTGLLAGLFHQRGEAWLPAVWRGGFTAVSAFCNAGFSLQGDSLVGYADSAPILLVVSLLIVVGGLGPVVVAALPRWVRGRRVSLHARIVITTTLLLLVGPTLFVLIVEWTGSLAGLGVGDRLVNAWFQSVTLRTAGFNSLDMAALHPATTTVMLVLMFIGGSPGSTAGGIKTTTAALVVAAAWASVRGRERPVLFGHAVPSATVNRALAITIVGLGAVLLATVVLQLTQRAALDRLLFEAVSASATVGLSLGVTPSLDGIGKVLIMACMFAGRVGPLSLFFFFLGQDRHAVLGRPTQDVPVG